MSSQTSSQIAAIASPTKFSTHLLQQRVNFDSQTLPKDLVAKLESIRQQASDRLDLLQFPTTKDEEWKYTDVSVLLKSHFQISSPLEQAISIENEVTEKTLPETANSILTFINGVYAPHFSNLHNIPESIIAGNLKELAKIENLENYLNKFTDTEDYFSVLNTSCFQDMAVIFVPKGIVITDPIQLLFVTSSQTSGTTETLISQPRCLVIAEANSSLTFVETYTGTDTFPYFTNAVMEIWLGENAQVNHIRVQQEGSESVHISSSVVAQSCSSQYTNYAITLGAQISRHNPHVKQLAEQTETSLYGLTLMAGKNHADTHSTIAHDYPYGTSKQVHKCIVDDRAHAVFNGKILVAKPAQLTNSSQLSRNLLLSPKARVDTKPQLEILADNVKCAHGATVSQLDTDELFYLQSRCIDVASAQTILTYAFAAEIVTQIPVDSLVQSLNDTVLARTQLRN